MTWRRVALYWCCFLALGAYFALFERTPAPPLAAPVSRAAFLTIDEGQIQSVEARRGDTVVRCRRVDGRWQVEQPTGTVIPSDLVASLIATVIELPEVEVVAEHPHALAPFGLDPPAVQLALTPAVGTPVTVRLGQRNPAGTAVYAQRSTGAGVFLIGINARYYADLLFAGAQRHGD
ncbi:MAG: DUF4340 domain-containing protein [Candidatus Binatia bacterium]